MLTVKKEINWPHWEQVKFVDLTSALFLSFDIEPFSKDTFTNLNYLTSEPTASNKALLCQILTNLQKRYEITCSHFNDKSSTLKFIPDDSVTKHSWMVDLRTFGDWATEIGLQIPQEFPRTNMHRAISMQRDGKEGTWLHFPHSTAELEIISEIMWEHWGDEKTPKQISVKRDIDRLFGTSTSDTVSSFASTLAARIRPHSQRPKTKIPKSKKR